MARITGGGDTTIYKIAKFLGLDENPDGDTVLKVGQLAAMRNFRITRDGHMQIRPGCKSVVSLSQALLDMGVSRDEVQGETGVHGVWHGNAGGVEHLLAVYGGHIWSIDPETGGAESVGTAARREASFFGFDGKVYLINGGEYLVWDGVSAGGFQPVEGYVPLIQVATTPQGEGTLLEEINLLTPRRRVSFSPDGEATVFYLPERRWDGVISATVDGEEVEIAEVSSALGWVKLAQAPEAGTDSLVIEYTKEHGDELSVRGMRFAELYNGSTDTRVFLYGDGSNRAVYSGIPYDTGRPSAEYFPALARVSVGESNTPLTALVRHYARLMAFKPGSAWSIQYGTVDLVDGATTAAFYVQPVNRQLGNELAGQVQLVENSPLSVDQGNIYQWRSNTNYSSYITSNENNAKRVSDRVQQTLDSYDMDALRTFNLRGRHEYWFLGEDGRALVLNYANDCWYAYEGLPYCRLVSVDGKVYGLCADGRVVHVDRQYRSDDGLGIDCYARTGSMAFDRDWLLKYSPQIYVAMQPETGARLLVQAQSDRRSDYPERPVGYDLMGFTHTNFGAFSFLTNRQPKVDRVRMKVKKATFYRLVFRSRSASAAATVLAVDIKLRYAGSVK